MVEEEFCVLSRLTTRGWLQLDVDDASGKVAHVFLARGALAVTTIVSFFREEIWKMGFLNERCKDWVTFYMTRHERHRQIWVRQHQLTLTTVHVK